MGLRLNHLSTEAGYNGHILEADALVDIANQQLVRNLSA
jgi:hypothetical protein